jgi:hypothetical protein
MGNKTDIWKDRPEKHDFPAALDYLSLHYEEKKARKLVRELRHAPGIRRKAKDLLRASHLPLLEKANPHVAVEIRKIKEGKSLSPVLLVRGGPAAGLRLIVADGYHRICASWHKDENMPIACRIVGAVD